MFLIWRCPHLLTEVTIRSAQLREKPYKLADGQGMYLEVFPNGSKLWRLKYRYEGREKRLSFGAYPGTSIKLARDRRDEARSNTFEAVARESLILQEKKLVPATYAKAVWTLETLVFPFIGERSIDNIKAADVLKLLKRINSSLRFVPIFTKT